MKNLKKVMTLVMTLALVAGFIQVPVVKAEAAEATTWYITYDKNSSQWYGSTDKVYWSYADLSKFAAGDSIVIDADGCDVPQYVAIVYQNANEVVFLNGAKAAVTAPYVAHTYAVTGAAGVVNGNVGKADAYTTGVLQVNGNVNEFVANYTENEADKCFFGVSGTVAKANVKWTGNLLANDTTVYNVATGKMKTNQWGWVDLAEGEYSLTPTAAATAPAAGQAAAGSNGKQLDAVPKTGAMGVSESAIFFGLAAVFAIGAVVYKKKAHN